LEILINIKKFNININITEIKRKEMDDLEIVFNDTIQNIVDNTSLEDFKLNCLYEHAIIIENSNNLISKINQSNLKFDKQTIINKITGKYLINLHEIYKIEDSNLHLHKIFSIIDLSLNIEKNDELSNYAMHTFISLLSYIYPVEFIIDYFCPIFFNDDDDDNKIRRLLLTKGNKIQGKIKPGSRLLVLYKQLINRIPMYLPKNEIIVSNFRNFITNSFEISDKLSHSLDWHMNLNNIDNNNGYITIFEQFFNSKKMLQIQSNSKYSKNIFIEFIKLMNLITTSNEQKIISNFNRLSSSSSSTTSTTSLKTTTTTSSSSSSSRQNESILRSIDLINRLLNNFNPDNILKIPINNKLNKQFKWILDEEIFINQLKNYEFYWSLKIQLLILLNFLNFMEFNNWNSICDLVIKDYSKFKKPDSLINSIVNKDSKRKLNDWIFYSKNGFKQKNYHYENLMDLLNNNEKTFTLMKLKNFVHPNINSLSLISESKKRKLDDYLENNHHLKLTILNKKPKFQYKLGSSKLSNLWNIETGLSNISKKIKTYTDILNEVKDDIYFARGELQSDPNNKDNKIKFDRLSWKGLRSTREIGEWFKLANTNENGDGIL
jgi:hypothetical protein